MNPKNLFNLNIISKKKLVDRYNIKSGQSCSSNFNIYHKKKKETNFLKIKIKKRANRESKEKNKIDRSDKVMHDEEYVDEVWQ